MSTAGKGTTGVIPTRSAQERDRACRALLEEAERLANAFHEGWLRNNEGFDRDRQRGEPPVPLKAFQYVARIARAGLENDAALAFLGLVRSAVVASLVSTGAILDTFTGLSLDSPRVAPHLSIVFRLECRREARVKGKARSARRLRALDPHLSLHSRRT